MTRASKGHACSKNRTPYTIKKSSLRVMLFGLIKVRSKKMDERYFTFLFFCFLLRFCLFHAGPVLFFTGTGTANKSDIAGEGEGLSGLPIAYYLLRLDITCDRFPRQLSLGTAFGGAGLSLCTQSQGMLSCPSIALSQDWTLGCTVNGGSWKGVLQ